MNELLLEKCTKFVDDRNELGRKTIFSLEQEHVAIAYIYTHFEKKLNYDAIKMCERIINKSFPFTSPYRISMPKVYAAMIAATDIEPDEFISHAKAFEEQFNRSFTDTNGLGLLSFSAASIPNLDYKSVYYKALSIYNQMKELHRFLTSDTDVVYAGLLALSPNLKDDVVDELVIMDDLLIHEYRLDNDYARLLSYILALCEGTATTKVRRAMEFIQSCTSSFDRALNYHYFVLHAILANLGVSLDHIQEDYKEVTTFLKYQKGYGIFSENAKELHACILLLEYYTPNSISNYAWIIAILYKILQNQTAHV
jgi:hypothetical protein